MRKLKIKVILYCKSKDKSENKSDSTDKSEDESDSLLILNKTDFVYLKKFLNGPLYFLNLFYSL